MDKYALLVKTDKGRDALVRRLPELGPRLRSLLIMVDGKRSASELDKLSGGGGGGLALLEQLLANGWIVVRDPGAPFQESTPFVDSQSPPVNATATAPGAVAAPAVAAPVSLAFVDARRLVARFVNDQAGPLGEQTAIRIEACKTAPELQSLLPRIREALQNVRGLNTVQRFDLEIVPQLPRL